MLVPKLRFKREDGSEYPEWKARQLKDVFVERNETQTITEDAPLLSFTIEQGVINPEDKKTNKRDFLIKDKDNKKYALTEYNDIIYNPANLKFGAIHRNKLRRGVVSPIYAIFHTDENPVFMEYIVTNPAFIKKSLKYLEGTVIKLMTLKPRDFLLMKCHIPCLEEQQKIADFLSNVDEVIAQSEAEVQNLEQQKKAAMQKIFSQEVRFKREDGTEYPAWEEKRLHQLVIPNDKIPVDTSKYRKITIGLRLKGVSFTETTREMADKRPFYLRKEGEIIVGKQNYFNGSIALITKEFNNTICSNAIMSFMPNDSVITLFLLSAISNNKYLKEREYMANGTGQKELSEKDFLNFSVSIPCLEEQQKIADFLSAYDEAISYAKQELDKWKELKKGLLQQMFV